MPTTASQRRMMLSDPAAAVQHWAAEAQTYGKYGNGVVFCQSEKDANLYMRIIETGSLIPPFNRTRSFSGAVEYTTLDDHASLMIRPISGSKDVPSIMGRRWPFMVFHNPALWSDRSPIRLLLPHLVPEICGRTTLISVGTNMTSDAPTAPETKAARKEIDYAAITRAMSGN